MTTQTYTHNGITLTRPMVEMLDTHAMGNPNHRTENGWLRVRHGITAAALIRRGLAEKVTRGGYRITDAGRAWLEAYDAAQAVAQANEKTEQLQHAANAFYSIATNPSGEISHYGSMPYRRALSDFRAHLELNFPDLAERSYDLAHLWAGDFGTEPVAEAVRALREKVADEKAMAAELTETEDANAEQAAHQAEVDAESEPRAYEPSAVVRGLITFYRTQVMEYSLDVRTGFVGAIREAVRMESRAQKLTMSMNEIFDWVRVRIS